MLNAEAVKSKFGQFARNYATCEVQAGDYTLARLIEVIQPQAEWEALDVATGAGHTAVALAKSVKEVVAVDLTPEMLAEAQKLTISEGHDNIRFVTADAGEIPFPDNNFDLVTCRLAIHHFTDPGQFFREAQRVLKACGVLAVVDSHLPNNDAFAAINRIQKLQDPSHHSCLTREQFADILLGSGFRLGVVEEGAVRLGFRSWSSRAQLSAEAADELRFLMTDGADRDTAELLAIKPDDAEDFTFAFQRILIVASKH